MGFGQHTLGSLNFLSVLEDNEGGNAADVESLCQFRNVIHIYLIEPNSRCLFSADRRIGARAWQGPHQGAQKSTRQVLEDLQINSSNSFLEEIACAINDYSFSEMDCRIESEKTVEILRNSYCTKWHFYGNIQN